MIIGALCLGIIGICFPPRQRETPLEAPREYEWEKIDRARRGSDNDPTRPDDHPLLLTHEIKRRR
jgi:hypothetical protein